MIIKLKNFKSWEDDTFDLGEKGITLLNGISGKGKTSIMQAIIYGLYGTGQKLTMFGKNKHQVSLIFDDITIVRSNNPRRLVVDDKYIDSEGQELIDKKFSNVFDKVGYVEQKSTNNFISMSPKDRLDFIEKFAFQDFDVDGFKTKIKLGLSDNTLSSTKIKGEIEMLDRIIEEMDLEHDLENNIFPMKCRKEEIPNIISYQDIKIEKLKKEIDNCREEIQEIKIKINNALHHNEKISELKQQIDDVKLSLKDVDYIGDESLKKYKKIISDYQHYQDIMKYRRIQNTIEKIKKNVLDGEEFKKLVDEREYLRNLRMNRKNYKRLKKEIEILNFDKEKLEQCRKELELIDTIYITCPQCYSVLSHKNGETKICMEEEHIDKNKTDLKRELKQMETTENKYISLTEQIKEYDIDYTDLDEDRIEELSTILDKQDDFKKDLKLNKRHQKDLCLTVFEIESEDEIKQMDYHELVQIVQTNNTNKRLIEKYEKELIPLEQKYNEKTKIVVNDLQQQLEDEKNVLEDKKNKLGNDIKAKELMNIYTEKNKLIDKYNDYVDKITDLTNDYQKLTNKVKSLETIKKTISVAQNIAIDKIIDTIEFNTQRYLDKFFEDPITISITTFTDKNKPQLNINLFYRDNDCIPNTLSGGEYDRLILATTLALSDLFGTNMIMLDEIIGSLDIESTSTIIDVIKDSTRDKLVIFIAHQLVSGVFDKVIYL